MAQTIQLRRGLQANVLAASPAAAGEIFFTTDTGMVYVYDGSAKQLIGRVWLGTLAARPAFGISGRIYLATDTNQLYVDTGTAWVTGSVTNLDQISDGTTYARVKSSELTSGFVKQINDGTNVVTASTAYTHINNANIHTPLNDSTTTTTNVWSAQKIQAAIDAKASGMSWQEPVNRSISYVKTTAGAPTGTATAGEYCLNTATNLLYVYGGSSWGTGTSLTTGDRFLFNLTGSDDSTNSGTNVADQKIYSYNGTSTTSVVPGADWAILRKSDETGLVYDADTTAWVQFSGAGQIVEGAGIAKNGNILSVRMGAGITELPTGEVGVDVTTTGGLELSSQLTGGQLRIKADVTTGATVAPIKLGGNGAGVEVDNVTLQHTLGVLSVKTISASQLGAGSITAVKLNSDVAGEALVLNGTTNAIEINLASTSGLSTSGDALTIVKDVTTGATVAPVSITANGVGVAVDNSSIVHTAGVLSVKVVDGGTF